MTLVLMVVGTSSRKLARLGQGDRLYALIGPLGHASEIDDFGTVVMVAGGVGTAPIYPIARALKAARQPRDLDPGRTHARACSSGTRSWPPSSDEHIVTTDDGSAGRKGLVTEPLKELLESRRRGRSAASTRSGRPS